MQTAKKDEKKTETCSNSSLQAYVPVEDVVAADDGYIAAVEAVGLVKHGQHGNTTAAAVAGSDIVTGFRLNI